MRRSVRMCAARIGMLGSVALLSCVSTELPRFVTSLPPEIPDLSTWEKSSGLAELDSPHRFVEYELFVGPTRVGLYEVVRYRVTITNADERRAAGISANEKLQWDVEGESLKRYECVAAFPPGTRDVPAPCRWTRLARGTPEFLNETGMILSIYGLHSQLLHERDAAQAREAR